MYLYCSGLVTVQLHELLPPAPPPPLSLSLSLSLSLLHRKLPPGHKAQSSDCCGDSTEFGRKKSLSLFFVSLFLSFGHVVLTLTENRPDVVDFKRNKVT